MRPMGQRPSGQDGQALETAKTNVKPLKSKSAIKTWIDAKLRKIFFNSFMKFRKIMCNTLNWFEKSL